MDWAVLVKVVPPPDALRYDPERKTILRDGPGMYLNPFDRRALQVALNLRRADERVTVTSMGPPSVAPALRDAFALGADRVVLVSDPSLAGSDTLVTARVLTRAVEKFGHHVTLLGRWSTDSETGQVGPEVAALLGVPVTSGAREVVREPDDSLVITSTVGRGWVRIRWRPPLVVTVGEQAAKVRRPTPAEVESARERPFETWSIADLGLTSESVGALGSPTVVVGLRNDEPHRSPLTLFEGEVAARARLAVERVLEKLAQVPGEVRTEFMPVHRPLVDTHEALALVTDHTGHLDAETLPLVSEIRTALPWLWPSALWVGTPPDLSDLTELAQSGAVRVYLVEAPPGPTDSRRVALAVHQVMDRRPRIAVGLFASNDFGREVAGQVAAEAGLGLTGDGVGVIAEPDGAIRWEKPAFGGGIIAAILSRTRPNLATIRPGSFAPDRDPRATAAGLDIERLGWPFPPVLGELLESGVEVESRFGDLDTAQVVITVGMGVGGPEAVSRIAELAGRLNGAVGATRRVADAGWVPRQLQVGLTGRSIAPRVAILVGVSGATNHLVGLRRARVLVALNSAPEAPVFQFADVALVGPWEETLPALVDELVRHEARVRG